MNKAYIGLGTNIEPRQRYLKEAIELINAKDIQIVNKSSIYETAPVGYTEQADFLNMVLEIHTLLTPDELLDKCQEVEAELGRVRVIRFGPRTIDLDILIYNDENKKTERLTIPHPRMQERGFVLVPLREIAPDLNIPGIGKTVDELYRQLPVQDKKDIHKWIKVELDEE